MYFVFEDCTIIQYPDRECKKMEKKKKSSIWKTCKHKMGNPIGALCSTGIELATQPLTSSQCVVFVYNPICITLYSFFLLLFS